jgi:two-component system, OmpR family, sensor histidine kinase ArlS
VKLLSKLTLFITLSKLAIVGLFVFILPYLVERIASIYTNNTLREQKKKVLDIVSRDGVDYYLQGEESYGSYTMLKEEYIALEPADNFVKLDTIQTTQRIIESDTLNYRVLSHTFRIGDNSYLLEIGKTTASISQYSRPLQLIALYVLISLVLITIVIDLLFTHSLLKPLGNIIRTKLLNQKFPFNHNIPPVKTSTSDFKYLDNSLIELMEQINEAFEKEREFTANASHELMTPISILQNKLENLMLHEDVNEPVQEKLVEMMRTLNRLKKIVHSLLLISRIDNAQFVKSDSVSVRELIDDIQEEMEQRFEEKTIAFSQQITSNVVLQNVNKDLLFQMLYNLVNNAIKYNKSEGRILISEGSSGSGSFSLVIEDTGIGINEQELPLIFNRFKKANYSEGVGFGLGLSIVKSIADFHAIDIDVASKLDEGTTFTISFPAEIVNLNRTVYQNLE